MSLFPSTVATVPWLVTWEHWNAGAWRRLTAKEIESLKRVRIAVVAPLLVADFGLHELAFAAINTDDETQGPWMVCVKHQPKPLTREQHCNIVEEAINSGEPVPENVRKEYGLV